MRNRNLKHKNNDSNKAAAASQRCWYCAHEWLTRISKGMARCPSCRTFNHLSEAKRKGVA